MEKRQTQEILPSTGIWTVEALADYLGIDPGTVQQKLTDLGVKVISFSTRYRKKIFRLEDLKKIEDPEDEDKD